MTKDHFKLYSILGGYALLCSLTPWAIPLGIVAVFGVLVYNGGYLG